MATCGIFGKRLLAIFAVQIFCSQVCVSMPENLQAEHKQHKKSTHNPSPNRPQVSPEDVLRPLENMADRFLQSETVGVFDSLTARAIESFAKLVDDAGLAVVSIVDRLPQTIDRVADTVDHVVKNADNLGREVAVIVSTPARAVLSGLNPDNRDRPFRRPNQETKAVLVATNSAKDVQSNIEILEVIPDSVYDSASPDANIIQGSSDILDEEANIRRFDEILLDSAASSVDLERGTRSSSTNPQGGANVLSSDQTANKDVPPPRRRRPFDFLSTLGIDMRNLNRRRNDAAQQQAERQKNVFERNFENSKTQASIQKLEEEFGGFLGRLLGTVYRNADNIDVSLSQGIRRVLGDHLDTMEAPPEVRPQVSGGGAVSLTKTPTTEFPFRLSFDDVEPAPVKNSALTLP